MYYVGLDVHLRRSSLEVLDQQGGLVRRLEVKGPWPELLEKVRELPRPFAICYEASCGYGYLHEKLSTVAQRVAVAHPGQLRLIFRAKKKNDRVDAGKLAKLLYLDEVPEVYVPGADVRAWRALIEYRRKVLSKVVKIKNQIRSLLRGLGIPIVRALWKPRGMQWLETQPLPESDQLRRDLMLEELAELQAKLARVDQELVRLGAVHPGVMLLQTIPGIGPKTAEAVVAYVDNIRRFGRTHQIGSYFGVVPCQDASADRNRLGHITGDGPATVRSLVCEAAWTGIRCSPTIRAFYERVMHGDPQRKKIAVVATAHYLLRVMAAMLRSGEVWRETVSVDTGARDSVTGSESKAAV
jgi:transposase